MYNKEHISLIGAGLAGPVMATYLSKLGFTVSIYESRTDMRVNSQSAGRSINLALSARGIKALMDIGVYDKIKPTLIPMSGRMIHDSDGKTHLQPYGQKRNEVIYSVSRSNLNKSILDTLAAKAKEIGYETGDEDLANELFGFAQFFPYGAGGKLNLTNHPDFISTKNKLLEDVEDYSAKKDSRLVAEAKRIKEQELNKTYYYMLIYLMQVKEMKQQTY